MMLDVGAPSKDLSCAMQTSKMSSKVSETHHTLQTRVAVYALYYG